MLHLLASRLISGPPGLGIPSAWCTSVCPNHCFRRRRPGLEVVSRNDNSGHPATKMMVPRWGAKDASTSRTFKFCCFTEGFTTKLIEHDAIGRCQRDDDASGRVQMFGLPRQASRGLRTGPWFGGLDCGGVIEIHRGPGFSSFRPCAGFAVCPWRPFDFLKVVHLSASPVTVRALT